KRREEVDRELEAARKEVRDHERRLERLEDSIEQKLDLINKKEKTLESSQRKLSDRIEETERRNQELAEHVSRQLETLQRLSGLTQDQAREMVFDRLENELSAEVGERILKHESTLRETCEQKAREILGTAIQRYAANYTAESTTSTVDIPTDDMKGRII